ncbi:PH, RCC1 and FYVE domains-containing protein 1-like protein [Tanacetum coccineum]
MSSQMGFWSSQMGFGFTRKRHNCYNCRLVHCHSCSSRKALIVTLAPNPSKLHRVCDSCFVKLNKLTEASVNNKRNAMPRLSAENKDRLDKVEMRLIGRSSQVTSLLQLKDVVLATGGDFRYAVPKPIVTGASSRSVSPFLRKSSPPRSSTPIPTTTSVSFSKNVTDSLKRTNDLLNQEVLKLREQWLLSKGAFGLDYVLFWMTVADRKLIQAIEARVAVIVNNILTRDLTIINTSGPEKFTVYVVVPMWLEGIPENASVQAILDWQRRTMEMMYKDIVQALEAQGHVEDPRDYLTFFCFGNREAKTSGEYEPSESPKLVSDYESLGGLTFHDLFDDEYIIVGSANINQRSMNYARDFEIAMGAYQTYHLSILKPARSQVDSFRLVSGLINIGDTSVTISCSMSIKSVRYEDSLTLNQCNRFQAGKKKRKIPLSFCTPSLEAGLSVRKWPGSGTCLSNSYVERPEVPSTGPETGSPIRNVRRRLMVIESYMSIIVSGSSTTNEHHVGATHIIRNPAMTDDGSMPIISNSDITDDTCVPISIIFNRFRNMGVNNTANTSGEVGDAIQQEAESGRVGRMIGEAIYPPLANIRKPYAHIVANVAAKVRKEEIQSRKQCQNSYGRSKGGSKAEGEDQFQ